MPDNLPKRPVAFTYPDDLDPIWVRRLPELACAANAVSLLMPYAEPYVARSIIRVRDELPEELREVATQYVRQETNHHKEHYRFNQIIEGKVRGLGPLLRSAEWAYGRLDRRSIHFGVAFAAGFETVAFASARWVDNRASDLFIGADPEVSGLFLWHLAEEVEHKSVADEVLRAIGVSRLKYAAAMTLSAVLLAVFAFAMTQVLLANARRLFNPVAHLRLMWWTLTFLMEVVPDMVLSLRSNHTAANFVDPPYLSAWLTRYDLDTLDTNSGLSEKPSMTSPLESPDSSRLSQ